MCQTRFALYSIDPLNTPVSLPTERILTELGTFDTEEEASSFLAANRDLFAEAGKTRFSIMSVLEIDR